MNKRQKIIVSITGITLVLLILVGLTYAYFLTRIQGNTNTKSISVTTADLKLVYGDGNANIITKEKIQPGEIIGTKDFTVTNEGNSTTEYVVVIDDVNIPNEFESNDFIYTLTCTSNINNNTCNSVKNGVFPITNDTILVGNKIEVGEIQTYELTVTYKETGIDQSSDMNKSLEARVNIKDINTINPYRSNINSLAYKIINNATNVSETESIENGTAKLMAVPLTTPAQDVVRKIFNKINENDINISNTTVSPSNEILYGDGYEITNSGRFRIKNAQIGVYSEVYNQLSGKYIVSNVSTYNNDGFTRSFHKVILADSEGNVSKKTINVSFLSDYTVSENILSVTNDNMGISYYYRGDVTNNYLNFNNMCWRIVRIEGDGSVKIILADKDNECDSENFNILDNAPIIEEGLYSDGDSLDYLSYINSNSTNHYAAYILKTFLNGGTYKSSGANNEEISQSFEGFNNEYKQYIKNNTWYIDDMNTTYDENGDKVTTSEQEAIYLSIAKRLSGNFETYTTLLYDDKVEKYESEIGLLTADEAMFAGDVYITGASSNAGYINKNYLDAKYSSPWYYLTPFGNALWANNIYINYASFARREALNITSVTGVSQQINGSIYKGIRPCITLKSSVEVTGVGTQNDPYEIN